MDYERIYREFIADRRLRESNLTGYSERHHILPRSMGGGDEPENLISLTAEDHFFAHLVLAKWLKTMAAWGAVIVMHERGSRCELFKRQARLRYGWARRRYGRFCAEERVGAANPNYKHETVALKRADGDVAARAERHGLRVNDLGSVARGEHTICAGWFIEGTSAGWPSGRLHFADERVHTIVHVDGREVSGTQRQIVALGLLPQQAASALVSGRRTSAHGWMTKERHISGFRPRLWSPYSAGADHGQAVAAA